MDKYDLRDLIDYSKRNNIEDKPIQEVYQLYKQEWEEATNTITPQDSPTPTTKKIKRRKWTKEENTYLLNKIKENPNNLLAQFNECAEHLGRTPKAIKSHWYKITNATNKDIAAFTLISSKKAVVNRKNSNNRVTIKSKESLFTKIINILFK